MKRSPKSASVLDLGAARAARGDVVDAGQRGVGSSRFKTVLVLDYHSPRLTCCSSSAAQRTRPWGRTTGSIASWSGPVRSTARRDVPRSGRGPFRPPQCVDHLANEPEAEPETRSLLDGGGPLELVEDAGLIVVGAPVSVRPDPDPGRAWGLVRP